MPVLRTLTMDAPAGSFCDALLWGIGQSGAAAHALVERERIELNPDTSRSSGPCAPRRPPGAAAT